MFADLLSRAIRAAVWQCMLLSTLALGRKHAHCHLVEAAITTDMVRPLGERALRRERRKPSMRPSSGGWKTCA